MTPLDTELSVHMVLVHPGSLQLHSQTGDFQLASACLDVF